MIIFIGEGGLGNQIFQYAFLSTIRRKKELIFGYGFDSLYQYFSLSNTHIISQKHQMIRIAVRYLLVPFLQLLSKLKIITAISQKGNNHSTVFGLFRNLRYVKPGFFQSQNFFNPAKITQFHLKNVYLKSARNYLRTLPSHNNLIYIHFRYGDYLSYRVSGKGVILPESYYLKSISLLTKRRKNLHFLLFSDDVSRIPSKILNLKNTTLIRDLDEGTTLAIMSMCTGAILSPSSFGWWGAYFMKDHQSVYAPLYWLGFNTGSEYPKHCTPTYAHTIRVK